jgi:hypothetical protein
MKQWDGSEALLDESALIDDEEFKMFLLELYSD